MAGVQKKLDAAEESVSVPLGRELDGMGHADSDAFGSPIRWGKEYEPVHQRQPLVVHPDVAVE